MRGSHDGTRGRRLRKGRERCRFSSNAAQAAVEGQYTIPGRIALRAIGFSEIPTVNVENACASASLAFYLACMELKAGEADVVLAVGANKMFTPDRDKNLVNLHRGRA